MPYEPQHFDHLLGTPGFSEQLLKNHFTLYHGYVNSTNKAIDLLMTLLREGKAGTPEFAEVKRRFGWEFNGMRLHELYFGNMNKQRAALAKDAAVLKQIAKDFGSFDVWDRGFQAVGTMRGIGWAVLAYDPLGKRLFNIWINEHDAGHLAGTIPLLVMDVFEHAFMLDYGLQRADYISAFFNAIDWAVVNQRFTSCLQ